MPTNLVRSKQDEADWAEARRIVDKQYPDKSPDDKDKSYWKLTTSIYENIKKNRGKKQMQKQASVGELLAGQIRLRKQADDSGPRSGVVGRIGDKLSDWLGWKKRPRGWSNPPKRTPDPVPTRPSDPVPTRPPAPAPNWYPMPNRPPQGKQVPLNEITGGGRVVPLNEITAGGHVDTAEYRGPGFVKRGGRWVQDYETPPIPRRLLDPAPAPRPFPIPRGIRGPWGRPEEQPNDPMENERIRRLVEGDNAPNGGRWGERPINDSEIPLPSEDPGGWTPPKNTPPNKLPSKGLDIEILEKLREWKPRFEDPGFWVEPKKKSPNDWHFEDPGFWVEPKSKPGSLQDWYWRNRPMSSAF